MLNRAEQHLFQHELRGCCFPPAFAGIEMITETSVERESTLLVPKNDK